MATGSDLVKKALNTTGKDGYYTGGLGKAFAVADVAGIVTADNKLQALGATIKSLVSFNLFGWSAGILGALFGIRAGVASVIRDSGSLEAAMRKVQAVKFYVAQFEPLVKGAAMARQYVSELYTLAGKGFDMSSYVDAARSLTVYTRGLYNSKENVKSLADASVRAGQDIRSTAPAAGQLIAALREGKPIAQFADELEQMGLISSTAARHMVEIQQNGGSVNAVMEVMQGEFDSAKGAADKAGESMAGLQTRLAAAREALAAKFGESFLKSEQQGIENTIGVLNNLAPIAGAVAGPLSQVVTIGNNVTSWIAKMLTGIPGLATAASVATRSIIAFAVAIGLVQAYRLLQGVMALTPGLVNMVKWLTSGQIAMNMSAASATRLAAAQTLYTQAAETAAAAAEAEAAGNAALSESLTAASVAQERQAAVQVLASRGMGVLATGIEGLTTAMRALLTATLLNPWFLLLAALAAVAGATWHAIETHHEHIRALRELQAAGREVVSGMDAQIAAMKTMDDQQQALIDSTSALAEARAKLNDLELQGRPVKEVEAQGKVVNKLQDRVEEVQNAKGLAPSSKQVELNQRLARQQVDQTEAEYQSRVALANPAQQREMRVARIAENDTKLEQGKTLVSERVRVEDKEGNIGAQLAGANKEVERLQAVKADNEKKGNKGFSFINSDIEDAKGMVAELQKEYGDVRLNSKSAVIKGMAETDRDEKSGAISHDEASSRRVQFEATRYDLEDKSDQRRQENVQLRGDDKAATREAAATQIDLDAEEKIAAIRARGAAATEQEAAIRIGALQKQLDTETYLDAQQRESIKNKIDGEQKALDMMRQENALQREAEKSALTVARLNRGSAVATAQGRLGDAAQLQRQAIAQSEAQSEKEDRRYAREHGDPDEEGYVSSQRQNRQGEREATRQEFLAQSGADAALRDAQLKAAGVGLSKTSKPGVNERELGRQDALRLADKGTARGRIEEALKNFATPEEAQAYAKKAGEQDIAKDTVGSGRGVIADSLQRIGGGGGVGGVDQTAELARRRTDLQQSILDLLKKNFKDTTPPPQTARFGP